MRRDQRSGRAAMLCLLALACLGAGAPAAEQNLDVTINRGEAYLIKGVDPSSTPEVRFSDGAAFSVQPRSASELLLLGVQKGSGSIKLSVNGKPTIYHVVVNAVAPAYSIAPSTAPPAVGTPAFSGETPSAAASRVGSEPGMGPAVAGVPEKSGEGASGAASSGASSVPAGAPAGLSEEPLGVSGTARAAPLPAGSAPPVTASQAGMIAPLPSQKYRTDPSAAPPLEASGREAPVEGHHLLPDDTVTLMSGTSLVYDFPAGIRRVSVSDSKIADVQVVNPQQLVLIGHDHGFASLVVWDRQGGYVERQVRVEQSGRQQVLLNVVVAEVNRSKIETEGIDFSLAFARLGLNFASLPGFVAAPYNSQQTIPGGSTGFLPQGGTALPLPVSSNITYAIAGQNREVATQAFFQYLENHNLATILAEPQLLANSGEQARFLSGGEIPIVIAQALNTSIIFKQFGTSVIFVPTVVGRHEIEMKVRPEVSKPDFTQGVQLFGFTVPAFITRRAETDVRIRDNETLLIAGLMEDDTTEDVRKVPYLGDVPYLGALFRNTSYNHVKTELVISVTPRIVQPIPPAGQLELPTERGPLSPSEIRTLPLSPQNASRPRLY